MRRTVHLCFVCFLLPSFFHKQIHSCGSSTSCWKFNSDFRSTTAKELSLSNSTKPFITDKKYNQTVTSKLCRANYSALSVSAVHTCSGLPKERPYRNAGHGTCDDVNVLCRLSRRSVEHLQVSINVHFFHKITLLCR